MIGTRVGNYRIVRQIGEGGMGAVFLGEHSILGRPAAIKVLLPEFSHQREVVARFFNEARAAAAIRHPAIVEIYDFGYLDDGAAYIAMEFLDGESLAARLRRVGRLPIPMVIRLGRQIAVALQVAHARDITHRDLKPDNVFITADPEIGERMKLLDFGIAKLAASDASGTRTRTGVVIGTPVYMSPEQCRGVGTLDHRSDLYSLGCVLYELVSGRPPFIGDSAGDVIAHHLYFEPEPVRVHEPTVPEPVAQLIMSLLAKDPAMRPASAAQVGELFERWTADAIAPTRMVPAVAATPSLAAALPAARPSAPSLPTTLSGSAGATTPAGSARRWWLAGAATLAAGIVAVTVVLVRHPDAPNGNPASTFATTEQAASPPTPPTPSSVAAPSPSSTPSVDRLAPPLAAPLPVPIAATPAHAHPSRGADPPTDASARVAAKPATNAAPSTEPPDTTAADVAPHGDVAARPVDTPTPRSPPATPRADSKWGHLMRDKSAGSVEIESLIKQCQNAAVRRDCAAARSIAARIEARDPATYRDRVSKDAAITACLANN